MITKQLPHVNRLKPCCSSALRTKNRQQSRAGSATAVVPAYSSALSHMQTRFGEVLARCSDIIMRISPRSTITYFSPEGCAQLGYLPHQMIGKKTLEFVHPDDVPSIREQMYKIRDEKSPGRVKTRLKCADGSYLWYESEIHYLFDEENNIVEIVSITGNTTSLIESKSLRTAAFSDALTGLDNRHSFLETIKRHMAACQTAPFTLFNIDLDRFKQVNDSLGHGAGDAYLIEITKRLKQSLPQSAFLARLGGDEFVALIPLALTAQEAMTQAALSIEAVSQPFQCKGVVLYPSISVGISFSRVAASSDEVLSQADVAMYHAKKQGGCSATVYDPAYEATFKQAFRIEAELVTAIRTGNVVVQYQPIVSSSSKLPCLAEALVRIRKPDGEILYPGYFVGVAEASGLIYELGQIVLKQSCYQIMRLARQGLFTVISVNVAPKQLMHVNYIQSVKDILQETGVDPRSIVLEVTESAVMDDQGKARAVLNELKKMGFILALDDFGQGHSSLSMLKNFPFDILKIDRSFVSDATGHAPEANPLSAIIDIGKMFKLTIVAEGIESEAQALNVTVLGCDFIQGYLYYQPLDSEAHFQLFMRKHAPLELRRFEVANTGASVQLF